MEELESVGCCIFCNEMFDKAVITRHLKTHFTKMEKSDNEISYHVKVENDPRYGKSPYFLNLWISDKARFEDIDDFLRSIWLDCCGHMSAFTDIETRKKNRRNFNFIDFEKDYVNESEIDMSQKVSKQFYAKQKIEYEYDYGTTTTLLITVLAILPIKAPEIIILLSRNEPLKLICEICKKEPATQICSVHYNQDNLFCKKCAKKHAKVCDDFDDYAAMPIVNSPRMGECAYEGGTIDTERDGTFIKK